MLFSSGYFLIYFLPLVVTVYFLLGESLRNPFLLISSLLFYWFGAPTFIFIILLTSTINFYLARQIHTQKKSKQFLFLYVAINLALLLYFKYTNFFIENANELLSEFGFKTIEWTKIILPIGISFFTFQSITYGVDIYRNEAEPQKNLANYLLYILFFPQLIAGPIVKYKSIQEQLTKREFSKENLLNGFYRFTIGLSKKVLLANVLAEFGDLLMTQNEFQISYSWNLSWLVMLAYTFEIYFDFSGYSDMAIGLGRMFGFTFPENFDRPYLSNSITQFWKKWHITLGDFMRNYLYIPLGGNRKALSRTYLNLSVVFILSGLWHGASWNFLLWGAFHGFWLIFERIIKVDRFKYIRAFQILVTFLIVLNGWVLFKFHSFSEAKEMFNALYSFENYSTFLTKDTFYYYSHLIIATLIILLGLIPNFHAIYHLKLRHFKTPVTYFSAFVILGLLFVLCVAHVITGSFNPFIYFQF